MKKLYLVDVSSMFFRAFYAIRPLTSPSGLPVNAVYGFLSMMVKLLKEEKPEYVVFCYDRKEPSFRKGLYPEYKANRSEMPEDLGVQIPYIKKLADVLGIPSVEVPDYEADDIIGSLARAGAKAGMDVQIVSGDKDFGQLVGDHVLLYDTMKGVRYDAAGVLEKWGVRPDQMIDYLAIVGDTSDNIPGVAGIGPKGAVKLLEQFKSLEDVYARLDEIASASVKDKLTKSKEQALLAKKLVTIVTDLPLAAPESYHLKPMDREGLRALLQELNFKAFEKSLLDSAAGATFSHAVGEATGKPAAAAKAPPAETRPTLEISDSAAESEIALLPAAELAARIPPGAELWALSDDRGLFVADGGTIYGLEGEPSALGPLLDAKTVAWSGFDLKAFWHRIGCETPLAAWDSMLAAYAVEAGDRCDLHKVVAAHLDVALPELASPAQWLAVHKKLREVLLAKLAERKADAVYREFDLPLAAVLLRMEKLGVAIDADLLAKQSAELAGEIAALEKDVHRLADETFNVGSPKQLGVILFEKLGLPAGRKTKTGYSTDVDVLEKLEHPIAKKVLEWRELSKLKSTYVDALPELRDARGRVHTNLRQALTSTGRLSSTDPNLQNIPVRTPRGQRVRQAFVAGPGLRLLSVDYSQIELRVLAHISGDPGLTRAFEQDLDIHAATAAEVFGVALDQVTADQRRTAKAVNFGIAYGQEVFGLSEALGIPREEAKDVITRYFDKFRGVRDYIENTTKNAHENGYVETLFGRRRYIAELSAKNGTVRKLGERAAINAPIQGTAADLVKIAMIRVAAQVPVPMILQVHDELIFEGSEAELEKWTPKIAEIMENVAKLNVPLRVNHALGRNWDEAH